MKQRGFFEILVVLAVLLAFGAGGYYFWAHKVAFQDKLTSQNPMIAYSPGPSGNKPAPTNLPNSNETANWKTYTDSKNKFSFKYPNEWDVYGKIGVGLNTELATPTGCSYVDGTCTSEISIVWYNNKDNKNLEEFFRDTRYLFSGYQIQNMQDITIDGQPAVKFTEIRNSSPSPGSKIADRINYVAIGYKGTVLVFSDTLNRHQSDGIFEKFIDALKFAK